jgi:PTH1 family peptidyl-tRNA hydrolase
VRRRDGKRERFVKLIVGLGNPGVEYQFTLHNLGFLAVDRLAGEWGATLANRRCRALTGKAVVAGSEVLLAKPETYMNLSGMSVRALVEEFEADPVRDLVVLYDDLDLPLGAIRVRKQGGAGGHHGMESIIAALGTRDFTRVRMGISPGHKVADGAQYVLSPIRKSQMDTLGEALDAAREAVKVILQEGPSAAMNRFNRKAEAAAEAE